MNSDFSEYCVKIYLGAWLFWELLTVVAGASLSPRPGAYFYLCARK